MKLGSKSRKMDLDKNFPKIVSEKKGCIISPA